MGKVSSRPFLTLTISLVHLNEKSQANGPYFESAVRVMARTCCEAEQSRNYNLLVRRMVLLIRLYIDITYLLFLTILYFVYMLQTLVLVHS